MAKGKGKAAEEEAETPEQAERLALQLEAESLHKISKREEQDFNEFQQQREKINYFWIVEKKKVEGLLYYYYYYYYYHYYYYYYYYYHYYYYKINEHNYVIKKENYKI